MSNDKKHAPHQGEFYLLGRRYFAPFFWTQFFGAFNDNLIKYSVMLLLGYQAAAFGLPKGVTGDTATQICGILFIVPFLLLSATSGQLADKYEKTTIIRFVKIFEVVIALLASLGLYQKNAGILLFAILLLGMHSTLFGPVKYAILPQHLSEDEIMSGNGLVEMGTFLAILLGEVLGGILIGATAPIWVGMVAVMIAMVGYFSARRIPLAPAAAPQLKINWNPVTETVANLRLAKQDPRVWFALLATSWFWFLGSIFMTQFLGLVRDGLHGSEQVVTLLLAIFSVGIGVGSVLCAKVSNHKADLGVVTWAAAGISFMAIDVYFAVPSVVSLAKDSGIVAVFSALQPWRLCIDIALLGFFGGMYAVPLYATMQSESAPECRSRIIASNNILNAIFLIVAALLTVLALHFMSPITLFLATGLLNLLGLFLLLWCQPRLRTASMSIMRTWLGRKE